MADSRLPDPNVKDFAGVQRNFDRIRLILKGLPTSFTSAVTSVNTQTGAVTLTASDVGALATGATAGGDLTGTYPNPSLAAYGTAGTYYKVTTDSKGRVNTGSFSLVAADIPSLDAGKITTGTFTTSQIPSLDAAKITTGTFTAAQIPSLDASKITTGTLSNSRLSGVELTANKAAASGYASLDATTKVPIAQVPTGTTSSTVALGNHSHLTTGTWGNIPRANTVLAGSTYFATDLVAPFLSDGTRWYRLGEQPAMIAALHRLSAPTGWLVCDGTSYDTYTSQLITAVATSTPAAGSVRYTTTSAHGLSIGSKVVVGGFVPTGYNGLFTVNTVPSSTQFTVTNATTTAVTTYGSITSSNVANGVQNLYSQYFDAVKSIAVGTCGQNQGTSGYFTSVSNTSMTDSAQTKFATLIGTTANASILGFVYTQYAYSAVATSGTISATTLPLIGNWMDIATGAVLSAGDSKYPVIGDAYIFSQSGGSQYYWSFKTLPLAAGQTIYGAVSGNVVSNTPDNITMSQTNAANTTGTTNSDQIRAINPALLRMATYNPDTSASTTLLNRPTYNYTLVATASGVGQQPGTGMNWYARI